MFAGDEGFLAIQPVGEEPGEVRCPRSYERPIFETAMNSIRIFISSPGDVATERVRSQRVIHKLQVEFGGRVKLEPFYWEHEPMRATASFNDPQNIPLTSEFDVVICILWSRLGTMLSDQFRRPDGSRYPSGTVFELETAHESFLRRKAPDLLVYRRKQEITLPLDDREARDRKILQFESLEAFIKDWFFDKDDTFKSALNSYETVCQFESLLEAHLRRLIQERIQQNLLTQGAGAFDEKVGFASYHAGNPFRGLEPFKFEDQDLFFGRSQAIEEVMSALRRQAADHHPVVIVQGLSGSGKSSLVRAGVMPLLMQPGVVENIAAWRRAEFNPGQSAEQVFLGLAECLFQQTALPELGRVGATAAVLAQMLENQPAKVPSLLGQALQQVSVDLQSVESLPAPPACRLILLIDQLEELFSDDRHFPPALRLKLDMAITALVESELVWCLITLRSDQISRLGELESLSNLTRQGGLSLLAAPSETDLSLMIRLPARAAGVEFEQDARSGLRLEDRLLMEARNAPDGLPLLSFVLQALYEKMTTGRNLLTHASLDGMQGLEGAVASQAEQAFGIYQDSLGGNAEGRANEALSVMMRALTTLSEDPEAPPLRRIAELAPLRENPDVRLLIDLLVAARLLTTGAADGEHASIHVTHEALFRKWPRIEEAINRDRKFLECRRRAESAANLWQARACRNEFLWDRGALLADAGFLLSHGAALDGPARDFVERSVSCSKKRKARNLAAAALLVIGIPCALLAMPGKPGKAELSESQKEEIRKLAKSKKVADLETQITKVLQSLDEAQWKVASMSDEEDYSSIPSPSFPDLEVSELGRRLIEEVPDHPLAYAAVIRADIAGARRIGEGDPAKTKELQADIEKRLSAWKSRGLPENELLDLKAQMAWDRGDRSQAALLWSDYVKTPEITDPVKRRVLERVSAVLIEQKKWREARLLLDDWIGWQDNAVARARRSGILLNELRIEEARKDLDQATQLQPSLPELKKLRPQVERAFSYLAEIKRTSGIIEKNPAANSPLPWIERAKVLLLAGRSDAALADVEQASRKMNGPSTFLKILRGIALIRSGGSLPSDNELIMFHIWRSDDRNFSTYLEEKWSEFMKLFGFDMMLAANPNDLQKRYHRGWTLWVLGQCKLALVDAQFLIGKDPGNARVQELHVACLNGCDRGAEGLKEADKALAANPGDPGLLRFRAEAQFDLGQYEAALLSIDQAIQKNPNAWVFWDLKSAVLKKLQRGDEAKQAADQAVRLKRKPQN